MTYKLTLPGDSKNLQTKDMIISLLAQNYPLTAKQISNKIKKEFQHSVTFPAVYKAINQLIDEGVLSKEGQEIMIDKKWIKKTKTFIDNLQKKYLTEVKEKKGSAIGEDIQVYYMDNLIDLDKFWIEIFEEWFENPKLKDDHLIQLCGHAWYILGQLENEEDCLNNIKKHKLKFHTLVDSDTFLDQWSSKYYLEKGFFYTTKKKSEIKHHKHYYIIYDDMIMETTYPDKLAEDLDKIYKKAKRIEDLDLKEMIKILKRKENLKITVMKNKHLADQLKKNILSHWKN